MIPLVQARPRQGAVEAIQKIKASGWKVIIYTGRTDLDDIADWLDDHDIPYDKIDHKPHAQIYVDDRALNAQRPWSDILQTVLTHHESPEKTKHIILTGHSGSGKSTIAKALGERLSLPVHKVDMDPLWQKNKDLADHPDRYTKGTKEAKQFRKLLKKLVRRAVAKETPHILEGCQFLACTGCLRGHNVIVIGGDEDTIIAQRLKRDFADGKLQRDGQEKRMQKAIDLYRKLQPDVERLKSRPGVKSISPHESEEWARRHVFETTMHQLIQSGEDPEIAKQHATELANFHLFDKPELDHQGEARKALPRTSEQLERAKAADLVTLPEGISGTNCGNCKFVKDGYCTHPKVDQEVNKRMCCAFWDATGTQRAWENHQEKALSAMSETSGGALVAPAQQGLTNRRKCSKCTAPLVKSGVGWRCSNPSCDWSVFAAGDMNFSARKFLYRKKGWVTIGGTSAQHGGRSEQHHGGTPVFIGEGGDIEKGPKKLQGKNPSELKPAKVAPSQIHGEARKLISPPKVKKTLGEQLELNPKEWSQVAGYQEAVAAATQAKFKKAGQKISDQLLERIYERAKKEWEQINQQISAEQSTKESPKKSPARRSKAKIEFGYSDPDGTKVINVAQKLFGISDPGDFASLVGAPDTATVTISAETSFINVSVHDEVEGFHALRDFSLDEEGKPYIHNANFFVNGDKQGKGLGARILADQVAFARSKGFAYLECTAIRGPGGNGYYTWPRLGYDAPLKNTLGPYSLEAAQKQFPGTQTIQDIMAAPGGIDWWKENGRTIRGAHFDLTDDSRSMKVHQAYLQERQARGQGKTGKS